MYKISVPIAIQSLSDRDTKTDLEKYLDYFKRGKIERVFVAVLPGVYTKAFEEDIKSEKFQMTIEFFKNEGLEVGVWIGGFGHGANLSHENSNEMRGKYQQIVGVNGESFSHGYCPTDESFVRDYMSSVEYIAKSGAELLMIDDDFRLNGRRYYFGCFCEKHLREYYEIIGEEIPREKIEELVFTGGKNKYRDAYMQLARKTKLDFAKKVRETVDGINPKMRVGFCITSGGWDFEGADAKEMAEVFAGNTKPFFRGAGAPYWNNTDALIDAVEYQRLERKWVKDLSRDIEFFAEGDVYTRPRYIVPSRMLELFDLALYCDGGFDGDLKYMFDYANRVGYETGYIERHIKNVEVFEEIKSLFDGKKSSGITVFSKMHRFENFVLPEKVEENIARITENIPENRLSYILSRNSVPTSYEKGKYPVAVIGESAKYIPLSMLSDGAVLDAAAAMHLKNRGVDTGIVAFERAENVTGEKYIDANDAIMNFGYCKINKIVCSGKANVSSVILPYETPGAYTYENGDRTRFLVFAWDFEMCGVYGQYEKYFNNYFCNYYRSVQIIKDLEWVGRKKLSAACPKNPYLYIMTAENDNSTAVLLENMFQDSVDNPVIMLGEEYSKIKFVNCGGELRGDKVYLSYIEPYGFAAFEVEK